MQAPARHAWRWLASRTRHFHATEMINNNAAHRHRNSVWSQRLIFRWAKLRARILMPLQWWFSLCSPLKLRRRPMMALHTALESDEYFEAHGRYQLHRSTVNVAYTTSWPGRGISFYLLRGILILPLFSINHRRVFRLKPLRGMRLETIGLGAQWCSISAYLLLLVNISIWHYRCIWSWNAAIGVAFENIDSTATLANSWREHYLVVCWHMPQRNVGCPPASIIASVNFAWRCRMAYQ